MYGLIRNDHNTVRVANRIFETRLYNLFLSDEELKNKIDMTAEEIFANISFYAYPEKNGIIEATLIKTENNLIFEFKDEGTEYNPLEKPDPDINLPPEERPLGGLGVYMVKQMTDDLFYNRENHQNILTLIFKI